MRLGPDAVLGEEGGGLEVAMTAVERGRLGVAARAVGVAQACLEDTVAYARERFAFGRSIAEFQIVQSQDLRHGVSAPRPRACSSASARRRSSAASGLAS